LPNRILYLSIDGDWAKLLTLNRG